MHLLSTFATGDRKIENAIRKSFRNDKEGYKTLEKLIKDKIVLTEFSREKLPFKEHPKQKLKKELRRYRPQNKIRFQKPFYRFWFRYIYPLNELILQHRYEEVITFILSDLDNFVSLSFEELANDLLKEKFKKVVRDGSYWDRKVELDIVLELANGEVIVGECKWKNSKICKKTLTSLQKKSELAGLNATYFALFSKSSFSNELLKNKNKQVLLFDLEDFKEWSKEKVYKPKEKKPYSFEF